MDRADHVAPAFAARTLRRINVDIRAEYAKTQNPPAPVPPLVGDPARGANLHRGCFGSYLNATYYKFP